MAGQSTSENLLGRACCGVVDASALRSVHFCCCGKKKATKEKTNIYIHEVRDSPIGLVTLVLYLKYSCQVLQAGGQLAADRRLAGGQWAVGGWRQAAAGGRGH